MSDRFIPSRALRLFQSLRFPRKLGFGELIWSRSLASHGVTWVAFSGLKWKLNLANDTHRWLVYGEYEELGVRTLLEGVLRPDDVIIDSGANIGQMILMYMRVERSLRIYAFEPTPQARDWLAECLRANELSTVAVNGIALGQSAETESLILHDFHFKEGAKDYVTAGGSGTPIEVTTLDSFTREQGIGRIRFWKLDVEGGELNALRGARVLLQRGRIDYLYIETAAAGDEIFDELAKSDYLAVSFERDRALEKNAVTARRCNVFASPLVSRDECRLDC